MIFALSLNNFFFKQEIKIENGKVNTVFAFGLSYVFAL